MKSIEDKRLREKQLVSQMIALYCRKNHNCKKDLCDDCKSLKEYAEMRIEKCAFMETKKFCSNCKVHCYKPQMREQIRKVMRFSGPRMIFYHPIIAIKHIIESSKEKKEQEKVK